MRYILSTATVLALALSAAAPAAHAQSVYPVVHFGVAGGATVPVSDFKDTHKTGWNAMALLGFQAPVSPIGFRVDANYSQLNGENSAFVDHTRIWSGTVNAIIHATGLVVSPYAIGGVGVYNVKTFLGGSPSDGISLPGDEGSVTKFGWNAGGGLQFHTPGATIFAEARFTSIMTSGEHTNFIPISVGIMFP